MIDNDKYTYYLTVNFNYHDVWLVFLIAYVQYFHLKLHKYQNSSQLSFALQTTSHP